jgi:hypothetical protein
MACTKEGMVLGVAPLIALALAAVALPLPLSAQDQKKFLEDDRRKEMDARPKPDPDMLQPLLWDAGGWLHLQFDRLDDPPFRDTRTDRYVDLRLWGELRIERNYTAYVRLQTDYVDFNTGDQFKGTEDDVFRSPHMDQAWIQADWTENRRGLVLRAGREFVSLGSGLLYNGVAYAAHGLYDAEQWAIQSFVAHSILGEDDIDQSHPNSGSTHRLFFGLEGELLLTGNHRAYAMFLLEHDFNRENVAVQEWDYNANYFGLGARGTIVAGWGYSAEAVLEFGETASVGTTSSDPILAFGFLMTTDYLFPGPMEPSIRFSYMFGSGDSDRASPTDMAAGNQAGTTDTSFLSFGFVQTGFSLFPRVANIHILRLGGTIRPLESIEALRKFEVGVFGYYYRKANSQELISDSRAFLNNADIGKEVDFLVRWRVFSDLGFSLNYGVFFPGKAYQERGARNFLSAGITYSF